MRIYQADAIVKACNSKLEMWGALARQIADAAGLGWEQKYLDWVKANPNGVP